MAAENSANKPYSRRYCRTRRVGDHQIPIQVEKLPHVVTEVDAVRLAIEQIRTDGKMTTPRECVPHDAAELAGDEHSHSPTP
jgi:hypothetical protein